MALSKIYAETRFGRATYPYIELTLRKYDYVNVVQGHYGYCGWEDLCGSCERSEAIADLRSYRENCPEYAHRIIRRRELNPVYEAMLKNKHRITSDGRIVLEKEWKWPDHSFMMSQPVGYGALASIKPLRNWNE